jgi:hypothetical protein
MLMCTRREGRGVGIRSRHGLAEYFGFFCGDSPRRWLCGGAFLLSPPASDEGGVSPGGSPIGPRAPAVPALAPLQRRGAGRGDALASARQRATRPTSIARRWRNRAARSAWCRLAPRAVRRPWQATCDAAPAAPWRRLPARGCSPSNPAIGRTVVTFSAFCVSVPVLSAHKTIDSNAWRSQDAPAAQIAPLGAWPLGFGRKAGDACSQDGASGVLVERDGWLWCEIRPMKATRSGTSSGDTAVGTRDAVDQAWRAMVDDVSNAWKTQG